MTAKQLPLSAIAGELGWPTESPAVDNAPDQCILEAHERESDMANKVTPHKTMAEYVEELKIHVIQLSLTRHKGNVRQVALELDVNRGGLYRTLERLGINCEDYRPE